MKKVIILIAVLSFATTLSAQIKGNVFWKYNDYVGNKPDAGATILLFDQNGGYQKTLTDVAGNFEYNGLEDGDYFITIISKNTTEEADSKILLLIDNRKQIQQSGFLDLTKADDDLAKYRTLYIDIVHRKNEIRDIENSGKKKKEIKDLLQEKKNELNLLTKEQNQLTNKVLNEIEMGSDPELTIPAINMLVGSYAQKAEMKSVIVKDGKAQSIIVDFGITYL